MGGPAIDLRNGSVARAEGCWLSGGVGFPLNVAPTWTADSTSTITSNPTSQPPRGLLSGSARLGESVSFDLTVRPGTAAAALLIGTSPVFQILGPPYVGVLTLEPIGAVGPLVVPATGILSLPYQIPASFPLYVTFQAQFMTFDAPTGAYRLSNSFLFLVTS
jgi:hypothetical protein